LRLLYIEKNFNILYHLLLNKIFLWLVSTFF
jgi:hypothetical protein